MPREEDENEQVSGYLRRYLELDVRREYERLKGLGRIDIAKLKDRDTLLETINDAAYNEHQAKRLFLKARREYELYLVKYNRRMWPLEKRAIVRIKAWMDSVGIKSRKQITKDDVVKEICASKDTRIKYRRLVTELEEMKEMRDLCESLANRWKSRSMLLNSQAKVVLGKVEIRMGGKRRV